MRGELLTKEVLAMYDVRGIQNYIFETNRIRDIIGASDLVEGIILGGLCEVCQKHGWSSEKYLLDWEQDDGETYLRDDSIQMQVLFVGGGNAYVLFRTGKICEAVNRDLAKYVLEHTYSLNLAVAVIEKTDDYSVDYRNINLRMREIKAVMPQVKPMGAFPFMPVDSATGYPLASYDHEAGEYVSTESALKRTCRTRDNMVTKKGDNSVLAVVHIDGNGMGNRIREIMQDKQGYPEAIRAMRQISKSLKYEFKDCYEQMCVRIDEDLAERIKPDPAGRLYRKIIFAGDDITFICNAKVALYAVKVFMQCLSTKCMYHDPALSETDNRKKYALSACAGIAFSHSHFPFSDAYEVAENCCKNAKAAAKLAQNRADGSRDGMIGNYVDFQMCNHLKAADLSAYREKQYRMPDGSMMCFRPYYVTCEAYDDVFDLNAREDNKAHDLEEILFQNLRVFQREGKGQSKYKKLRNMFSCGMGEVEKEITFLQSRQTKLPETKPLSWYDALELVSVCEPGEGRES